MITKHFNELDEAEQERLAILAEECAEVGHIICKILRHGYQSTNPKDCILPRKTNREILELELGDLMHAICRLTEAGDLSGASIDMRAEWKRSAIAPYLHHQPAGAGGEA